VPTPTPAPVAAVVAPRPAPLVAAVAAAAPAKALPPHLRVMQLKARALGDATIAEADRVWFELQVTAPLTPALRPGISSKANPGAVPIFLSKYIDLSSSSMSSFRLSISMSLISCSIRKYTIGRCLDSVCKHTGVPNRNNEAGAPKLALATAPLSAAEAPTPLPSDIPLELLLAQLPSGSTILLIQT
jgi:hypothetical protein